MKNKKDKEKIYLKCKRCKNKWYYSGNSLWYITCPKCKTTINIRIIRKKIETVCKIKNEK